MNLNRWLCAIPALCLAPILVAAHVSAQQADQPRDLPPTLQVNVNKALVPVVVRDKQGHTVDGLKVEDFQVFDNDKPHAISAFNIEHRGAPEAMPANATASGEQPSAPANAAPQPAATPDPVVVFLFDDMHMSFDDLAYARKAGVKEISGVLTGSVLGGVVSTSGKVNSGLSRDPAKLVQAMASLSPRPTDKSDCPMIELLPGRPDVE